MRRKQKQQDETGLPVGLSKPARRALEAAGYTRLEQFTAVREADLLRLHGVGPKAIVTLRDALSGFGLTFSGGGS